MTGAQVVCRAAWSWACLLSATLLAPAMVVAAQGGAADTVARVQQLFEQSDVKRVVAPAPGSRSIIVAIDGSSPLYLFLERGSIRGGAIDTFYEQYEAGDYAAAYQTFVQNSTIVLRASDYGWNGLGNPLTTESGAQVEDMFYKVSGGMFQMAEVTEEDVSQYEQMLEEVAVPVLSGQE